jgi:hypothetical protein
MATALNNSSVDFRDDKGRCSDVDRLSRPDGVAFGVPYVTDKLTIPLTGPAFSEVGLFFGVDCLREDGALRPSRHRITSPNNADVVEMRGRRAALRTEFYECDFKCGFLNHLAEALDRGTLAIFL